MTVTVTVSGGVPAEIAAEGANETAGVGSRAIEELPGRIVEAGSVEVDGVSGATVTSNALKSAVAEALRQAAGEERPALSKQRRLYRPGEGAYRVCGGSGYGKRERHRVGGAGGDHPL